jgi:hypothetical protein
MLKLNFSGIKKLQIFAPKNHQLTLFTPKPKHLPQKRAFLQNPIFRS